VSDDIQRGENFCRLIFLREGIRQFSHAALWCYLRSQSGHFSICCCELGSTWKGIGRLETASLSQAELRVYDDLSPSRKGAMGPFKHGVPTVRSMGRCLMAKHKLMAVVKDKAGSIVGAQCMSCGAVVLFENGNLPDNFSEQECKPQDTGGRLEDPDS